jgi:hypothetical protein
MINVRISGSHHVPPHYNVVPEQMEKLMAWYVEHAYESHFNEGGISSCDYQGN